jgi:hypothetical protein
MAAAAAGAGACPPRPLRPFPRPARGAVGGAAAGASMSTSIEEKAAVWAASISSAYILLREGEEGETKKTNKVRK